MTVRIALLLLGLALAGSAGAQDSVFSRSTWIGGTVDISRTTEGPVIAIGGNVTVTAPVDGGVRAAGGMVTLGPDAAISGDVSVAGGTVIVEGPILGDLRAAGGKVRIDGQVVGDASVAAGTLELGPHARIQGHLAFHGGDLQREPGAEVIGGMATPRGHRHTHERIVGAPYPHGWLWTVVLMALAALIAGALPGASQRMAQELRERPWLTPFLGLVALTSIPIASVLVMITIIGIPLGLLALMVYAALLLVGYVWLAVVVGGMLLDRVNPETAARTAWRVGAAVLAMLVLALLVRVPFVGGLFKLAALAVGVGMIVTALFRHSSTAPTRAAG